MKQKIIIQIPEPCQMRLEDMTEVKDGFHCAACQKTVIDFTLLSDSQIVDFFKQAAGKGVCGFFQEHQLNRALVVPEKSWLNDKVIKRAAAAILIFQSFAQQSFAQVRKQPHKTVQAPGKKQALPYYSVKGRVMDYALMKPVAGIPVRIDSLALEAVSDKNGYFYFKIPRELDLQTVITIQHNTAKQETTTFEIPAQSASLETLLEQALVLYSYPVQLLPAEMIVAERLIVPPVGSRGGGAVLIRQEEIKPIRNSRWWHVTHPFHRKKRN